MDQYLSTYRKDFMWPYVKTLPTWKDESGPHNRSTPPSPCMCSAEAGMSITPKQYGAPLDPENYQWSRLGPMAPLLDPKLYPAKMGPPPEFEITRYDQPNTYLKKLQEKHPYLYSVLQSVPPDEMLRRVNEDRLKTTYQVDYSHIDEHPPSNYEKLPGQTGISMRRDEIPDCRSQLKPPDCRAQLGSSNYRVDPSVHSFDHEKAINGVAEYGNGVSRGRNNGSHFPASNTGYGNVDETRGSATHGNGLKSDREPAANVAKTMTADRGGRRNDGSGTGNGKGHNDIRETREVTGTEKTGTSNGGGGVRSDGGGAGRGNSGGTRSNNGSTGGGGTGSGTGGGGTGSGTGGGGTGGGSSSSEGKKSKTSKHSTDDSNESSKNVLPPWKSEYQEVIGQTGLDIMKDRIHHRGERNGANGANWIERMIKKCPL